MHLISIQILRAFAALTVAVGHGQSFIGVPTEKAGEAFAWNYLLPWRAGVDLFFVISGFIIVYSSERLFAQPGGARAFAWRRLSRIVPLYWATTSLVLIAGALRHKPGHDPLSVLMSLLFVPWDTDGLPIPRPVYELGWTLNYEMFFYALFALTVGFARETAGMIVLALLAGLSLFGLFVEPASPQAFVWTRAIILEFGFGVAIALLARRQVTLPAVVRWAGMIGGTAILLYDPMQSHLHAHDWLTPNDLWRVLGWGVPAAMIFAGAVLAPKPETVRAPSAPARLLAHLGDASYALYLIHPVVMGGVAAAWFGLRLNHWLHPWIAVAATVALSCLVASLIYRYFERPVTNALQAPGAARGVTPAE